MKKEQNTPFSEQKNSTNAEDFINDKQSESYDTVLDEVVEDDLENAEAEYEGVSEEELDDEPPL